MKRTFILFLVGFLALATVAYVAYLFFDAIRGMVRDRRLAREMDELEAWSREKKRQASGSEE